MAIVGHTSGANVDMRSRNAFAWSSPSSDSGTSMSRVAMSIIACPSASARSRATFPELSPWRTSHSDDGQRSAPAMGTGDPYPATRLQNDEVPEGDTIHRTAANLDRALGGKALV